MYKIKQPFWRLYNLVYKTVQNDILEKKKYFGKWMKMYKMIYVLGYDVHFNIQNRAEWYTLLYKLIYGNVQNKTPFLKIVQLGLQNCSNWSSKNKIISLKNAVTYKLIYVYISNVHYDVRKCENWKKLGGKRWNDRNCNHSNDF